MYKIKNNSKGKVIIGDLNIILNFNDEIDLESKVSREQISKSNHLRHAISKNIILLIEDTESKPNIDINDLQKQVKDIIAEEIKKIPQAEQNNDNNIDKKFDMIVDLLSKNSSISSKNDNFETEEDEEKMSAIHKKMIEKMNNKNISQINAEKTEIVKNHDINVDELEGLI